MKDKRLSDQEIIAECRDRFALSMAAESENRKNALEDLKFANGDQWEPMMRDERFNDSRPYLTINLTDAVVRRVVNAVRENRPQVKCRPAGDGASIEDAKVRNGVIRGIWNQSHGDFATDVAVESAIRGGWPGYIGVDGDYVTEDSFDQELKIIAFPNPFMCYADPASRAPDGSDMGWFIESELLKRAEYKASFGHIDGNWNFMGDGDNIGDWSNKEEIRIAKYWRVEHLKDEALLLSTGKTLLRSTLSENGIRKADMIGAGVTILQTRPTVRRQVKCYLLNAFRVLEERDWPGKYIPRVPVYGRSLDINGKIERKGVIRDLQDPARIFNFAETAATESYALQPKAPWLMAEGQMEGHEAAWRDANRKPIVALPYKPVTVMTAQGEQILPPPQRQNPPPVAEGFEAWANAAKSNFLAVAGMPNDPGQDAKGEVVSGIALRRRQGISDISHYDFYDNLTRSLRHVGEIILDLMPFYYDTQRMVLSIGDDDTPQMVTINEQAAERVKNDLTQGRYTCYVDTGPSYQTKREESADAQLELLATPLGEMVAKGAGDVVVRSLDFPNADLIADRISALIPGAQTDKSSDLPQKAQIIIQSLQAQLADARKQGMALELELNAKHGLEQMRQSGETQRLTMKERAETERTRMEIAAKLHDTHVKAVTAHDVAEIREVGGLLNTHTEAEHNKAAAKELEKSASRAEESDV